jgi:hypothetical protein
MPTPVYKGTFPVVTSESTRYFDRGKIEFARTQVYKRANVVTGNIGQANSLQIDGKTLSLTSISVNTKDGLSEITQTYSGGDSSAPEVYEVVATCSEEPISTHPAFTVSTGIYDVSSIVDAAGAENVNFDQSNVFVSFAKDANNNFFGVSSYLSPQVQYRRIYSSGTEPTIDQTGNVGYIFDDPEGYPPTIGAGRTWLQVSVVIKNNGNQKTSSGQFEITEEYRGSGISGWNPYIYPTFAA